MMPSQMAQDLFSRSRHLSVGIRYVAATVLVLVAAGVSWLLGPFLQSEHYFLFEVAVGISAIFFDRGSGLWATVLSAFMATLFFVPPWNSFALSDADTVTLLLFILVCLLLSAAGEYIRSLAGSFHMAKEALQAAESQKDALYREHNHRTRNNFHLIGSTVSLQMHRASHPEARESLQAVLDRITSIARVDHLLHAPENGQTIDAHDYLNDLAEDISGSLVGFKPITISCAAQPYPLSREVAETLGITVNELVTNAIKYAFPEDRPGRIRVGFRAEGGDLVLTVDDDGRGVPQDATGGTGWKLIASLVRWCDGAMAWEDAHPGCRVIVRIPEKAAVRHRPETETEAPKPGSVRGNGKD
jgi:two-component sensor histidine kinase